MKLQLKPFLVAVILLLAGNTALAAFFDSSTGTLHLPAVFDGENTYIDAVITLHPDGTYSLDGELSELPFRCEREFNEATLELITEEMSAEDIDSALGCRWSHFSSNRLQATPSETYTWLDFNCTRLSVSPDIGDQNLFNESLLYVSSCGLNPDRNGLYDLTAERFFIKTALIDGAVAAPDVILQFNSAAQTISLISAVVEPLSETPEVCSLFPLDVLDSPAGLATTPEGLSDALGCQWTYNIITTDQGTGSISQVFWDHECNSIYTFIDKHSGLIIGLQFDYRRTGCGF